MVIPGDKRKEKRKITPLVLGVVVGILIITLAVLVALFTQNSDRKVLVLLEQNVDTVTNVDGILSDAFYGTLTTEDFFSDDTSEIINRDFPRLVEFTKQFTKINPTKVSADVKDSVVKVQEGLKLRSQDLASTLQLYNNLRNIAFGENNEILKEYTSNENENLQFLSRRFADVGADSFWRSTTIPQVVLSTYDADLYYYKPLTPEIKNIINELRR